MKFFKLMILVVVVSVPLAVTRCAYVDYHRATQSKHDEAIAFYLGFELFPVVAFLFLYVSGVACVTIVLVAHRWGKGHPRRHGGPFARVADLVIDNPGD